MKITKNMREMVEGVKSAQVAEYRRIAEVNGMSKDVLKDIVNTVVDATVEIVEKNYKFNFKSGDHIGRGMIKIKELSATYIHEIVSDIINYRVFDEYKEGQVKLGDRIILDNRVHFVSDVRYSDGVATLVSKKDNGVEVTSIVKLDKLDGCEKYVPGFEKFSARTLKEA